MGKYVAGFGLVVAVMALLVGLGLQQRTSKAENTIKEKSYVKYNDLTPEGAKQLFDWQFLQ